MIHDASARLSLFPPLSEESIIKGGLLTGIMARENPGRYSRQELVVGKEGQGRLQKARVAIIGLGALGSVAAELLARAGIGHLTLIDRDIVELSNLQRQLLYAEADIGKPKAEAAHSRLKAINGTVHYGSLVADINHKNIGKILEDEGLVLDCTDNLYARFLINDWAKKRGRPWIYSAAIREQGSVMLLAPGMPCFRCTFREAQGLDTCDTAGISNAISTAIASLQVNEAIRYLTREKRLAKESDSQCLIRLDLSSLSLAKIKTKKNPQCPACSGQYEYLGGKKEPRHISYQCSDTYQFFIDNLDLASCEKKWKRLGTVRKGKNYLFFKNLSVFSNGRVLIKAKSLGQANAILSRYAGM